VKIYRKRIACVGIAAAIAVLLASCSSDGDSSTETQESLAPSASATVSASSSPTAEEAVPSPTAADIATAPATATAVAEPAAVPAGGTLRIAALSSPADTLNPAATTGPLEYSVLFHIHDSLVLQKGGEFVLQLAESIEPNADATEWTITLVEGARFHDGRPVTAADVAYSLGLLAASPNFGQSYAAVNLEGSTIVDDRTLIIPMRAPRGDLLEAVFGQLSLIVPDGFTDWGNNIGSGPYKLVSFEPGVGALLERNPDYWGDPPALDTLEFVGIADPATRLNALRSGDIDYAWNISAAGAASIEGDSSLETHRDSGGGSLIRGFVLNLNTPPFDNPDVVRAVKLAIDRWALIDVVLLGNGEIGNDMPSKGLPGYNDSIPQVERDVDTARELFTAAGVDSFTMRAADLVPGIVDSSELFAQQMAEAGVTVTVEEADAATYFNDFAAVFSTPAQGMYYINRSAGVHMGSFSGSQGTFNISGYATPEFDAGLADMQATVNVDERLQKTEELLAMIHYEDGLVVWAFEPQINASIPGIERVSLIQSSPYFASAYLN